MAMRLAIVPKAGAANILEFDLCIEVSKDRGGEITDPALKPRVITAHAPFDLPGEKYKNTPHLRLHIASADADLRKASIDHLCAYADGAHRQYPKLELINMHAAPKRFPHPPVSPNHLPKGVPFEEGTPEAWARLCEGVRAVARHCGKLGLKLAVENNLAYWQGIAPETPAEQVDRRQFAEYWCTAPEEWCRLQQEVNEPNLVACLDPSHATPYVHRFATVPERRAALAKYLPSGPVGARFGHLHWNDSDPETSAGRQDMHLCIGEGTLGAAFHGELKRWAVANSRVPLLEHFYSRDRLVQELDYIERL